MPLPPVAPVSSSSVACGGAADLDDWRSEGGAVPVAPVATAGSHWYQDQFGHNEPPTSSAPLMLRIQPRPPLALRLAYFNGTTTTACMGMDNDPRLFSDLSISEILADALVIAEEIDALVSNMEHGRE